MIERLSKIVKDNANSIAYVINNEKISYQDLWDRCLEKADLLVRHGSEPVILYGHKSIDMVVSIISCLLANRTYIPVDVCTPISRIKKIIDMTGSTLLIKNEVIDIDGIECCTLDELSNYKTKDEHIFDNNIVYIIFTSGSTGDPKGVPISKMNLLNFIDWISNLNPLNEYQSVNVLNQASFSFDLSVADFYYSLFNGHTLVALDREVQNDFTRMFDVIKQNDITVAVMTPTFMKFCLLNSDFCELNFRNLKCVYFCGEMLEVKLVKKIFSKFPDLKVINAYGPTEATSAVSAILISNDMVENEEILPVGEVGKFATEIVVDNDEIILKGPSVFGGYINNIGGYFQTDGVNCYKTGDIGFFKDNKLYCKGRIDNQIKYKGYRIELSDIENNLSKIKGVRDCAVIAKYNDDGLVKLIKAFVVLDDDYSIDMVKSDLKDLIPRYMMPNQIKQIDILPINCNRKIDRKLLSEL